ncbi:hypothetical protein Pyrfu_0461 [Pyrolobus fumarii 1A]|uniref:CRISPR-associated protein Cas6 C-terminal domain-containing protein n=1 Tax=Pyrolobus fumarii (strain DSM 11204 / 1A) TaxID=694429 RepID=G0EG84_PYRF1|nr:CRISPR system precrRNA processing endoribonuclease RAMP protein Cas6 [Pyrolobus fumarii]AEM38332.1 hypothetical protein Pyrfu_0461 [Pyrolobus fumarii 1A]
MARFERWSFTVRVYGFGSLRVCNYTGKLVKSLLAVCSERFASILSSSEKSVAKRLSVTPLFRVTGPGRVEAVYPGGPQRDKIRAPVLEDGEVVFFEVGAGGDLINEMPRLLECLSRGVSVRFCGAAITVEPVEARMIAEYDTHSDPIVRLDGVEAVKIVFRSPTLPVNPWRPGSRWKRLLPTPSYLLAVNAHDMFDPDTALVERALIAAERILSPSHAALDTARVYWYLYDGSRLPAMIGYVKLHVETEGVGKGEVETVEHLLSHAVVMGVGSGRAAGFGAVSIEAMPSTDRLEG